MSFLPMAAFVALALHPGPPARSDLSTVWAQSAQPTPAAVSAKQYLDNAMQALSGVAEEALPNDARKVFSQLQSDFAALSSAYSAGRAPLQIDPDANTTDHTRLTPDWMTRFYDVERDLALLIGGATLAPSTASSLLRQQDVPDISLLGQNDPSQANRTVLERFRLQLELFYDATGHEGPGTAKE